MAESTDVCNAIASAVWTAVAPLVGTTYTIPEPVDAEAVGASQIVPNTTVILSRPLQKDLEDRLAAGKCTISVESDENDAVTQQFVNEGARQDLISTDPVTLTVTSPTQNAYVFGGTITAGNIVGVQAGTIGASYVVLITDTLASVTAGVLAQCTVEGITASISGGTLYVSPAMGLAQVLIGANSTWLRAVSRTARHFDVTFWCPDPYIRQYLVRMTESAFYPGQKLIMPDTSVALIEARIGTVSFTTLDSDGAERDNLFIARTRWLIEYTVTRLVVKAPVLACTVTLNSVAIDTSIPLLASQL